MGCGDWVFNSYKNRFFSGEVAIRGTGVLAASGPRFAQSHARPLDGKGSGAVLRYAKAFTTSIERMPRYFEALVFVHPHALLSRFEAVSLHVVARIPGSSSMD